MRYMMVRDRDGRKEYWQETPDSFARRNIGISGGFVYTEKEATKIPESWHRETPLGAGLRWEAYSERHSNALLIDQGACNPSGIALTLHESFREIIAEGGDTKAQREDPACRLILHQLAFLLGATGIYSLSEYRQYVNACREKVEQSS